MANNVEQIVLEELNNGRTSDKKLSKPCCSTSICPAVLTSNLLSFCCGLSFGWMPVFKMSFSSVYMQSMWAEMMLYIGGLVIPLFLVVIVNKYGRKTLLVVSAINLLLSFLLCALSETFIMFHVARVVQGSGVGVTLMVLPMYLSEISSKEIRGLVCCSIGFSMQIGIMVSSFVSGLVSVRRFSLLCVIPVLTFLIVFCRWNPESPVFLAFHNKEQQLKHSLKILKKEVDEETYNINKYLAVIRHQKNTTNSLLQKGFFLVMLLFVCQTITGERFFSMYIGMRSSGFEILIGTTSFFIRMLVQLLGVVVALFTVDKLGRKILLLTSTIGSIISLISLGVFFYLHFEYNFALPFWATTTLQIFYAFFWHLGLFTVPWVILGEFIACLQKPVIFALSISCYFIANIFFRYFIIIVHYYFRQDFAAWLFALSNLVSFLFVLLLIPETKQKSLQEIQHLLYRGVA